MTICCATTNPGKLREFGLIFGHYSGGAVTAASVPPLPPPEETERTFAGNAALKACYYSRHVPGLVMADDSGLSVDALGGDPGVYSARYAGEHATDSENNALLLRNMRGLPDRTARFVCAIAVARGGELIASFEDFVEGQIVTEPSGPHGFGYDPLFFYPPFGATFGDTPPERKLLVSHRGKAVARMIAWALATPPRESVL